MREAHAEYVSGRTFTITLFMLALRALIWRTAPRGDAAVPPLVGLGSGRGHAPAAAGGAVDVG